MNNYENVNVVAKNKFSANLLLREIFKYLNKKYEHSILQYILGCSSFYHN